MNLLYSALSFIYKIGYLYFLLIDVYIIMSWIRPIRGSKIYDLFRKISRPYMSIFEYKLVIGNFDLGGTLGILGYYVLLKLLLSIISSL